VRYYVNEQGATFLLGTIGFPLFLLGRATGAAILRKLKAHRVLGTYAIANVLLCGIVILRLGWISVAAMFLSFFFMSIMFPTIFALGIYGLGVQAKRASGFIVMAIIGGAIMPKLMGYLGRCLEHVFQLPRATRLFCASSRCMDIRGLD
jgi:FHS family L-fucose permease-like MFS transporter